MAQYIQKRYQQTPLNVGKVEDSLESNSTQNAPSVRVVSAIDDRVTTLEEDGVNGDSFPVGTIIDYQGDIADIPTGYEVYDYVPRKQLLINNDFQINQRGQGNYTISDNVWNLKYTVDMWYIQNGMSVDVLKLSKNVIKITNIGVSDGYFGQSTDFKITKNNTLVIKVNSLTGSVCLPDLLDVPQLKVGLNVFDLKGIEESNDLRRVLLKLNVGANIEIEYIDLFEGDVAYPHVKEDYTIALMRCMSYIIALNGKFAFGNVYRNSFYTNIPLPVAMKETPTITISGAVIIDGLEVKTIQNIESVNLIKNGVACRIILSSDFSSNNDGKCAHFESSTKALIT